MGHKLNRVTDMDFPLTSYQSRKINSDEVRNIYIQPVSLHQRQKLLLLPNQRQSVLFTCTVSVKKLNSSSSDDDSFPDFLPLAMDTGKVEGRFLLALSWGLAENRKTYSWQFITLHKKMKKINLSINAKYAFYS